MPINKPDEDGLIYQYCPSCGHKDYDSPKVHPDHAKQDRQCKFCDFDDEQDRKGKPQPKLLHPGTEEWDREFIL